MASAADGDTDTHVSLFDDNFNLTVILSLPLGSYFFALGLDLFQSSATAFSVQEASTIDAIGALFNLLATAVTSTFYVVSTLALVFWWAIFPILLLACGPWWLSFHAARFLGITKKLSAVVASVTFAVSFSLGMVSVMRALTDDQLAGEDLIFAAVFPLAFFLVSWSLYRNV